MPAPTFNLPVLGTAPNQYATEQGLEQEVQRVLNLTWAELPSLIDWTLSEAFTVSSVTYDSQGVISSAAVVWRDGGTGTFTTTIVNQTFLTIDAFNVTHVGLGRRVTQPAVTRNDQGQVTVRPALTVGAI